MASQWNATGCDATSPMGGDGRYWAEFAMRVVE